MRTWIQVDSGIKEHDKIYNLADKLHIPNAYAVGLMTCLWAWVSTTCPDDGDVTNFPPRAIAVAAGWEKKSQKDIQKFYDALSSSQLLEKTDEGRILIRNWHERENFLIDYVEKQKENNRRRVQKCREQKKQQKNVTDANSVTPCNVTETSCNDFTVTKPPPDHNQTISKLSDNNNPVPSTEENATESEMRDLAIVGEAFQNGVKDVVSSHDSESLQVLIKKYSVSRVLAAIDEAKKCKGHSSAYVKRVLEGWERDGKSPSGQSSGPNLMDPERYKNFGK